MYPDKYGYTKQHEWAVAESGLATIGITDHAQKELGDIVYVDLPRPGDAAAAGKPIGSVESVKAVSEVFSPVTGEVVESNQALADAPEKVNEDAHGEGWLVKIKLSAPEEMSRLLSAADYEAYLKEGGEGTD